MGQDILILMGEIHIKGRLKGWALKSSFFLFPETATSKASGI
jgi:hypothetical protein